MKINLEKTKKDIKNQIEYQNWLMEEYPFIMFVVSYKQKKEINKNKKEYFLKNK